MDRVPLGNRDLQEDEVSNRTDSSEFPSPGSAPEDVVELHTSGHFQAHLAPMPTGMILFPRRMLYVEAVLYFAHRRGIVRCGLSYRP